MNHNIITESISIVNDNYKSQDETIINELRQIIQKTGSPIL